MAIIPLRSPRYEILTTPSGAVSAKLELTIDSTLRYTITKSCTAGETVTFEISELCRDYITPAMYTSGNFALSNLSKIDISRAITFYDGANATGSVVSGGNTVAYDGFDGYGAYMEGANWEIPEGATNAYLLSKNPSDTYQIFLPANTSTQIIGLDSSEEKTSISVGATDTSEINRSSTCTITRVDCSKYTPTRIWFVNKFGAIQSLYFFTKEVEVLNTNQETYQRNTIDTSTTTASYFRPADSGNPTYPHPISTFTKNGKKSYSLSSGYYPEWANVYFEQLLLSEYVWIGEMVGSAIKPLAVQVKTSSMTYKTSLNDRLIEYTIEFEESFDHINNVR